MNTFTNIQYAIKPVIKNESLYDRGSFSLESPNKVRSNEAKIKKEEASCKVRPGVVKNVIGKIRITNSCSNADQETADDPKKVLSELDVAFEEMMKSISWMDDEVDAKEQQDDKPIMFCKLKSNLQWMRAAVDETDDNGAMTDSNKSRVQSDTYTENSKCDNLSLQTTTKYISRYSASVESSDCASIKSTSSSSMELTDIASFDNRQNIADKETTESVLLAGVVKCGESETRLLELENVKRKDDNCHEHGELKHADDTERDDSEEEHVVEIEKTQNGIGKFDSNPQNNHENSTITPKQTEIRQYLMVEDGIKTFSVKSRVRSHQLAETRDRPHQCPVCSKQFKKCSHLKAHMFTHTNEKPHKCSNCLKTFKTSDALKKHKKTHSKTHKCSICQKSFTRSHSLKLHTKTHSNERPHKCSVCEKSFKGFYYLKIHEQTHSVENSPKCFICEKTFVTAQYLKTHTLIHTNENPYTCSNCLKTFKTSDALKRHTKTHSKPHKCSFCEKTFAEAYNLKIHTRIHTNENPHKCSICQKAFKSSDSLKLHTKTHSNKRPYK